ncbi:ATP-binding protein [Mucilaginibacter jinjuensis]|uniref:AAA family ATPase n=1 Tax=Mucilaginibacter jinjuensis TaxID=1176721 RepID=A0ABY7T2I2_9SPHI|nr:AAA family ATPase [Mucilaginibacter jinjuensis]WCT10028.1 AAA family ATPase [Mucilaginibacter jinjuensis]
MESKPTDLLVLQQEMDWLQQVIDQVIKTYLMQEGHENNWLDIAPQDLSEIDSPYAASVKDWRLDIYGRLALVLAMAPHVRPDVLDVFFGKNQIYDRGFTEFGGVVDKNHSGFLPTGQTLCFLIASSDPQLRTVVLDLLSKDSILIKEEVLFLAETDAYLPRLNGILSLNNSWFNYFLTGEQLQIEKSASFPAQKITTPMDWEDVVLDEHVMQQITEINTWLQHGETLMNDWGLFKKIKPGYRSLFYGPPGTGKTLTATLIGKAAGRDVYKVDLSMIISKYIGETEKNLSKVFDTAQHTDWILFFDEADALFGKRTAANSSNDTHANQQTAYLLQRIEDFPGIVILASNLKANMDEAFTRRFQSMIHFNMPSVEERYQLWQNAFSGKCTLHPDIDLYKVAEDYELAGGAIINILRYCALAAIQRNDTVVTKEELFSGLRNELKKENKTISISH